ncbi:MAG: hypothetical protein K6U03_04050 [Firmicutes bacterium]|nr:hypothetical protein [Bacillota bacterium]
MNIPERRWWKACLFISLDAIKPFQNGLWLRFLDLEKYQRLIQNVILPFFEGGRNPEDNRYINTAIMLKNIYKYNPDTFYQLAWWVRNVFLSDGPDRASEMFWSSITLKTFHQKATNVVPIWIYDSLCRIAQAYIKEDDTISDMIMKNIIQSKWDEQILSMQGIDIDNIQTKLNLILSYNVFVDIWDKIIGDLECDKMVELYTYGLRVAEETMKGIHLDFPGSWKLELDEYRKPSRQSLHHRHE